MSKRWVAHINGKLDEEGFEISVLIEGTHGQQSWGWSGTDKIIILEGDKYDYSRYHYGKAKQRAEAIANVLNNLA